MVRTLNPGITTSESHESENDVPLLIDARFLNGLERSMNTMPMLNIWTPPPDIYSMKACIGRDLAGATAKSHARLAFNSSYDAVAVVVAVALFDVLDCTDEANPGGGGRCFHLQQLLSGARGVPL